MGCFYPSRGRESLWHAPIHEHLLKGRGDMLEQAALQAREHEYEHAILSYEGFFRLPEAAIALFHKVLGKAKVAIFLRRQDQLSNSRYNQLVKAHRVGIEDIVNFERRMLDYDPELDHWKTMRKWAAVFGDENLVPIVYDKRRNSVEAFFSALGMQVGGTGTDGPNPNPALDAKALSLFREMKSRAANQADLPALVEAARRLMHDHLVDTYANERENYYLTGEARRRIFSHYRASNEMLRKHYFREREELFPSLDNDPGPPEPAPLDERMLQDIFESAGISPR